ncbi:MAG: glucose dehydrogenase, partial [Comamonadaceae bacterium]|nr:glucose dehydrogenase [Comamonadaceae bacterium]
MNQAQTLAGQVAAVTGAASGIGFASAQAMVSAGAQVVLIDRDAAALARACESLGATALPLLLDLLDPAQCAALPEHVLSLGGQLDVFHANAGLYVGGDLIDTSDE